MLFVNLRFADGLESGCQSHTGNVQQVLCAGFGLHAFMLSLAEQVCIMTADAKLRHWH